MSGHRGVRNSGLRFVIEIFFKARFERFDLVETLYRGFHSRNVTSRPIYQSSWRANAVNLNERVQVLKDHNLRSLFQLQLLGDATTRFQFRSPEVAKVALALGRDFIVDIVRHFHRILGEERRARGAKPIQAASVYFVGFGVCTDDSKFPPSVSRSRGVPLVQLLKLPHRAAITYANVFQRLDEL